AIRKVGAMCHSSVSVASREQGVLAYSPHVNAEWRLERATPQQISRFSERYACGTFARMTRLPIRMFLFLLLTISISAYGQETVPVPSKISAAEILEKNLIATGGLEAHKALETLVASGEIHLNITQRIGEYKFSYKAPNNEMLELRMLGRGATWTG